MKTNSIINELIGIGLTASEARVYYHLLRKRIFTASEIAHLAQVPQSKIYGILSKLVQKGLCTEILGKVKKYSSVNPGVGFTNMCNELEAMKKRISNLSKTLLPLYNTEKDKTDPLDYIKVLRDKNSIMQKKRTLDKIAQKGVKSLVKGPYVMDTSNNKNMIDQVASMKKGVKHKTIYKYSEMKNPDFCESVKKLVAVGEEIRISHKLPFKMFLYDQKEIMFSLEDKIASKPSLTALIIEHDDMAKGLEQIFDLYWENSITLEEFEAREQ